MFGTQYQPDTLAGVELKEGRAPIGPDELVVDKATATREGFEVGDQVSYSTDTGIYTAELVGTVGTPDSDSFLGVSVVAVDLETALDHFDANGLVNQINVGITDDADIDQVEADIVAALGSEYEIVDREMLIEEFQDQIGQFISIFGTGLLIFAFVTAFVAAFIINNVFQITIGQRLRELALLRAIGASGKQVRRMISIEALGVGIAGTVFGVIAGLGVAQLIVVGFNAIGAGFPSSTPVLLPHGHRGGHRRHRRHHAVGHRALTSRGEVPPVAAMRPELGFPAIRSRRLVVGAVTSAIGVVMLLVGLFVSPGGTFALIVLAGGGALLLFLGIASVSATIGDTRDQGDRLAHCQALQDAAQPARDNVAGAPRRTSSSASALMIGVALVSAAAVFASSLRESITATLGDRCRPTTSCRAPAVVVDRATAGSRRSSSRPSPSCRRSRPPHRSASPPPRSATTPRR